MTQRCCAVCGETFEVERKAGRPRLYCYGCEPVGWSLVRVPHQDRLKLRRRRWGKPEVAPNLRLVAVDDGCSDEARPWVPLLSCAMYFA